MKVWIACTLAACGRLRFDPVPQPDATTQVPQKLYVAEPNAVEVFAIDPGGAPRQFVAVPTQVSQVVGIALDASGQYAVVGGTAVASFAIDATGALGMEHDSAPVAMRSIAAHTTAAMFYGIDTTGCRVHEFSLDRASGTIVEVGSKPLAVPCGELFISVDPLGRWIFIPGNGATRGIDVGTLDASGHLLAVNRSGIGGSSMIASVSDPSGKYLYLADNGADGVFGFAIDQSTGAVTTAVPGTPAFPSQFTQALVAFAPAGTSLYAFDESPDAYHFAFDAATGAISAAPATTGAPNSPCDADLYSAVFSRDGKYVYGADEFTPGIFAYAIDPGTGLLAALPGSPFAIGGVAMSIAISR